jgi:hypothetical protein
MGRDYVKVDRKTQDIVLRSGHGSPASAGAGQVRALSEILTAVG